MLTGVGAEDGGLVDHGRRFKESHRGRLRTRVEYSGRGQGCEEREVRVDGERARRLARGRAEIRPAEEQDDERRKQECQTPT